VLTANIYLIAAPQPNSNQHVWVDMHCHSWMSRLGSKWLAEKKIQKIELLTSRWNLLCNFTAHLWHQAKAHQWLRLIIFDYSPFPMLFPFLPLPKNRISVNHCADFSQALFIGTYLLKR
jgi:hypothetical protein